MRLLVAVSAVVAATVAVLVFVYWPSVAAQARAVVVLVSVLQPPVAAPIADAVTGEPRVEERRIAGNPTSVFVPAGGGPHPAVLFVNGAVLEGRRLPEVRRLAEGLARAGYLVVVPDLPGLTNDTITTTTLSETVQAAREVSDRPDARGGKVGLIGASTGATLSILAAGDPELSGHVSAVVGIAPYTDIRTVLGVGTTAHYERGGELFPYSAEPFLSYVVARSVIATLPPGGDRESLQAQVSGVRRNDPDPLAGLRDHPAHGLGPEAQSVLALLANQNPHRFEGLYRDLPAGSRSDLEKLSPVDGTERLSAPVEIVSGPADKYFPVSESYNLERVAPERRVTVTRVLDHSQVRFSLRDLEEFLELNGFATRALWELRAGGERKDAGRT